MMDSRKFKKEAKKCIAKMGYKTVEWKASCCDWAFGFVRDGKMCYGCIAFASTGAITVEILQQKEYKTFNISL